jgi:hypothetical protein
MSKMQHLRYRTLRALGFLTVRYPGVSLRSTPGFMLPPAAQVLEDKPAIDLLRASFSLSQGSKLLQAATN